MGLFSSKTVPLSRQPRVTRTDSTGRTFTRLPGGAWSADPALTRRAWRQERRMERDGSIRGSQRGRS